jgi:hypothetical protein
LRTHLLIIFYFLHQRVRLGYKHIGSFDSMHTLLTRLELLITLSLDIG